MGASLRALADDRGRGLRAAALTAHEQHGEQAGEHLAVDER